MRLPHRWCHLAFTGRWWQGIHSTRQSGDKALVLAWHAGLSVCLRRELGREWRGGGAAADADTPLS